MKNEGDDMSGYQDLEIRQRIANARRDLAEAEQELRQMHQPRSDKTRDNEFQEDEWPEVLERYILHRVVVSDLVPGDLFMFCSVGASHHRTVTMVVEESGARAGMVHYDGGPEDGGTICYVVGKPKQSPVALRIMEHWRREPTYG